MDDAPIHRALREAALAATPRSTARAVVDECVAAVEAECGGYYKLDLSAGVYAPFVQEDGLPDFTVPVEGLVVPGSRIGDLGTFLSHAVPPAPTARAGVAVYTFRGSSCVGILTIEGPSLQELDEQIRRDLLASADLMGLVYESEFAYNLLTELQQPLDFHLADDRFFRLIGSLIRASSRMEFVALREHVDDELRCIALEGFGRGRNLREWDLKPVDAHPDFATALQRATVTARRLDPVRHAALIAHPWSRNVRSFVAIPVVVGNDVFGVLSVAARCEFEYSEVELRGFESIANAVGVSITNFRNSRELALRVGEYAETAMAITALEVARAVKHEALNCVNTATAGLRKLWIRVGKPNDDVDIDGVGDALQRLGAVLSEITATPTSLTPGVWSRTSVAEVWKEAVRAVSGRLDEQKIAVRSPAADVVVYARPEWLRQVFLNLLLNSIDAFREQKKGGRRIELAVEARGRRASEVVATYNDNAGGISPNRLRGPEASEELPVEQRIFQEGVTSKRDGSGFGLWLVRHILTEQHASIDLTGYRGGVTFALRFPRAEDAEAKVRGAT